MKSGLHFLLGLAMLVIVAKAQLPHHTPPTVTRTTNGCNLDWTGQSGITYFVQYSLDLETWSYMPIIESGLNAPLGYGFQCGTDKMFVRLHYTNVSTSDPNNADFDGDGVSNWDEVRADGTGTSPLEWDTSGDGQSDYFSDQDGNTIADGWELKHFGSIGTADPLADPDEDGESNAAESYLDTDPNAHAETNDEDEDGLVDAVDAVPDDALINWPATPITDYAYLELDDIVGMEHVTAVALSEAGHVLVKAWPVGLPRNGLSQQHFVWQPETGTWSGPLSKSYNGNQAAVIHATGIGADGAIVGTVIVEKDTLDSGGNPDVVTFHSRITWTDASADPYPEAGDRFAVQQPNYNPSSLVLAPAIAPDEQIFSMARGAYTDFLNGQYVAIAPSLVTLGVENLEPWVVEDSDPPDSYGVTNHYGAPGAGKRVTMTRVEGYYDEAAEETDYKETGVFLYQNGSRETVDSSEWISAQSVAAMPDQEQEPGSGRLAVTGSYTWIKKDGLWQRTKRPVSGDYITPSGIILTPGSDASRDLWINGEFFLLEELCPAITEKNYQSHSIVKMNDGGAMLVQATDQSGDQKVGLALPVNTAVGAEIHYDGDDPAKSPSQANQPASPDTQRHLESKLAWRKNFVPADKEDTEGGWLVVNFDDDDNDSGAWGHGQTNPKPDKDDTNGVAGENDLLNLGIAKIPGKGVSYRIKYNDFHIKIWKKKTKGGQAQRVVSEQTTFTIADNRKWLPLYIEGIEPHSDDTGTKITAQFKIGTNGEWKDADSVKVRVAYPIIAVFGDGGTWAADRANLFNYAKDLAGKNERRKRGATFLVPGKSQQGKDVCYSITGLTGNGNPGQASPVEKIIKIALAMRDTDIIITGHCNYGVGLALGKNFNSFNQFFNMAGGGTASISLSHFGAGEHPLMNVRSVPLQWNVSVINDRNQRALNTPHNRHMQGAGLLPNIHRYPQAPGGTQVAIGSNFPNKNLSWTNNATSSGNIRWHYIAHPGLDGNGADDKHTILNTGAADVPSTLRYRSLFLNQCNTYRSFAETFKHGTLISAWASVSSSSLAKAYTENIVQGKTWAAMETALEALELLNDPNVAPNRGMFEITNF